MKKINWLTGTVLTTMASLLVFPSLAKAQENMSTNPFEFNHGGTDASIPYIISPRYTLLNDSNFTISWHGVEGANSYMVTLQGEDGLNWTKEVNGTETVYDGEQDLSPDTYYLLTVEADTGVSSMADQGKSLAFALANNDKIKYVETETATINNSNFTPENQAIALANLYDSTNLNAEAITTLEGLVSQGTQNSLVYQMLGDVYAETGLNSLAETSYNEAIELAQGSNNLEVLANAQAGLAGVNLILGNHFQAGKLAQQAETNYQTLGNDHHAMMLEETLMTLIDQPTDNMTLRATRGADNNPFANVVAPQVCEAWDIPGVTC
jgi:tetratricopeptide (TPR) repeat protein